MADQLKELAEIPRDFIKDGTQFLNRCTKRTSFAVADTTTANFCAADRREFIKICQAVGIGFVVMGTIGYFVKLSMSLHASHRLEVKDTAGKRWALTP